MEEKKSLSGHSTVIEPSFEVLLLEFDRQAKGTDHPVTYPASLPLNCLGDGTPRLPLICHQDDASFIRGDHWDAGYFSPCLLSRPLKPVSG
jgi:hypothetical protein